MNRYKTGKSVVYIFLPFAFLLTAYTSLQTGKDNTTPYKFDMPANLLPVQSPKDNPPTNEGVALGRMLFYEPLLSGNKTQACADCHEQAMAFSDGKAFSAGSEGKKSRRNSMALVNLGFQDKYFWDGRAQTLEDLIHFPVTDSLEMNADTTVIVKRLQSHKNYPLLFKKAFGTDNITMALTAKAIAQFLRTIVSLNSPFDRIFRDYLYNGGEIENHHASEINDPTLVLNGLENGNEKKFGHDSTLICLLQSISPDKKVLTVFARCLTCHYNTLQLFCIKCNGGIQENALVQFKNNGLEIEGKDKGIYQLTKNTSDKYRFKVPTFRNLALTAPYMHDGRFNTLEEVVEHYNSGIQPNSNLDSLLMDEKKQPIRFNLTGEEKKQLVGLLKLFSDSSVITNPNYASPF